MKGIYEGPWDKPWGFLDVGRADSQSKDPGLVEPGEASRWQEAGASRLVQEPLGCLDAARLDFLPSTFNKVHP